MVLLTPGACRMGNPIRRPESFFGPTADPRRGAVERAIHSLDPQVG